MALKKGIDEVLALIADPKERAAQAAMFEKYPVLQDGYLAQADYSSKSDKLRQEREKIEADHKAWEKWYADANATAAEKDKLATEAEARVKTLEAQVAAAANGGDVDQAQINAAVEARVAELAKTSGYVSKADMDAIVQQEVKRAQEFIPQAMTHAMTIGKLGRKYEREFTGKEFDDFAFNKFVADNGFKELDKAYDAYVSEDRKKLEIDAAVKKAVEENEAKLRTEFSAQSPTGVPGSGAFPQSAPGPVQMLVQGTKPAGEIPDYRLGDGTAARLAGQELRAEGKVSA